MPALPSITQRNKLVDSVRLNASGKTDPIKNEYYGRTGCIFPSGMYGTSVTFQVATVSSGPYYPLRDSSGAVVTTPVTLGAAVSLSDNLTVWPFFQIVSNAAETGAEKITYVRMS